jgi:hypothetical protein
LTGNILSSSISGDLQWYFGGSPIPGETSPWLIVSSSGSYWVELTSPNGCVFQSNIIVYGTVDIAETELEFLVTTLVNSNLRVVSNQPGTYNYKIFDLNGRLLDSGNVDGGANIRVENLSFGTYILQLENHSFKFVKMN